MVNPRNTLSPSEYNDECSITYEKFHDLAKQNNLVVTNCGHKFSKIAISEWADKHSSCPMCRHHLEKRDLKNVALDTDNIAKDRLQHNEKEVDDQNAMEEAALELARRESLKTIPNPQANPQVHNPISPLADRRISRLDNIQPRPSSTHASFRELERISPTHEAIIRLKRRIEIIVIIVLLKQRFHFNPFMPIFSPARYYEHRFDCISRVDYIPVAHRLISSMA